MAQSLVQQKHAFAIVEESSYFSLVDKYLQQQRTPVVSGLPSDGGPEWGIPATSDLVDGSGASDANQPDARWEWLIPMLKADHITRLATIAAGAFAMSVGYANGINTAVEAAGIQVGDEDNSLAATETELTPNAIGMKNAGANGWIGVLAPSTEEAVITALHQQGANVKGDVFDSYEGTWVTPPMTSVAQGLVATSSNETPELDPGAGGQIVDAMGTYTADKGTTGWGLPDGASHGWASADLAIQGLGAAGKNLPTGSFLDGLHKQKTYTVGGIQPPLHLAQSKQGTYAPSTVGNCAFALEVVSAKCVPLSRNPCCTAGGFDK